MGDNSMFYDEPKKLLFPFIIVDKFSGAVKEMAKSVADFEKSKEIVSKISEGMDEEKSVTINKAHDVGGSVPLIDASKMVMPSGPFSFDHTPYLKEGDSSSTKMISIVKGCSVGRTGTLPNPNDYPTMVLPEFTGYGVKEVIKGVVPSKSNSYRIVTIKSKDPLKKGFSSLAKTKEAKAYETAFILQCRKYRNANIDCDFNFEIDVYYPSRRADLDNSLKGVLDLLQLVRAIKNDNRTQQIIARRHIDKNDPRIEFSITKANQ